MEELISTLVQNAIQNGETITPYEVEYTRSSMQREINNLKAAIDDFNSTLSPENSDFAILNDGDKIGEFITLMKARADNGSIDFKSITRSEALAFEMKDFAENMFLENRVDTLYGRAVDAGIKGTMAAAFVGLSAEEIAKTSLFKNNTVEVLSQLSASVGTKALTEFFKNQGMDEKTAEVGAALVDAEAVGQVDLDDSVSIENDLYNSLMNRVLDSDTVLRSGRYADSQIRSATLASAKQFMFMHCRTKDGGFELEPLRKEFGEEVYQAFRGFEEIKAEELIEAKDIIDEQGRTNPFREELSDNREKFQRYALYKTEIIEASMREIEKRNLFASLVKKQQKSFMYDLSRRGANIEQNPLEVSMDTFMKMVPDFVNDLPIKDTIAEVSIDSRGYTSSKVLENFEQRVDPTSFIEEDIQQDTENPEINRLEVEPEVESIVEEAPMQSEIVPEEQEPQPAEANLGDIPELGDLGLGAIEGIGDLDPSVFQGLGDVGVSEPQVEEIQADGTEQPTQTEQEVGTGSTLDFLRKAASEVTPEEIASEEAEQAIVQEQAEKPSLKGAIEEFKYQRKFGRGLIGATTGFMGNVGAVMVGSVRSTLSRIFNRQKALPPPTNIPQEVKGVSQDGKSSGVEEQTIEQVEAPGIEPQETVIPGIISQETRDSFIPRVTIDERKVIAEMEQRREEQERKAEEPAPQTPVQTEDFINDFQMD